MSEKYEITDPLEADVVENCMYEIKWRWSSEGRWGIFIAMNPSTTSKYGLATNPTVSKCRTIAENANCGGMILLDLFPYAAAGWQKLMDAKNRDKNIMGNENKHQKLFEEVLQIPNSLIVLAWGQNRPCEFKYTVGFDERIAHVLKIIKDNSQNADIRYLEKADEQGLISHPFWLKPISYNLVPYDYRKNPY